MPIVGVSKTTNNDDFDSATGMHFPAFLTTKCWVARNKTRRSQQL